MDKRPLFSIIIPCYNSKPERIRELLTSIYNAGANAVTEIIIVDDRSINRDYLDVVDEFNDNTPRHKYLTDYEYIPLNIKIMQIADAELEHCPGNTRETGLRIAEGEWITFVDHDDLLIKGSLAQIKSIIEATNEKYVVYSDFYMENEETNERTEMKDNIAKNWTHGKFFNYDNLWNKYDLHFPTNMKSHEDVYITNKINCILNKLTGRILHPCIFTYVCRDFLDNTTNSRTDNRTNFVKFINDYFEDYIDSTMNLYTEEYNKLNNKFYYKEGCSEDDINFYKYIQADSIIFLYFYIQALKYNYKNNFNLLYEYKVKKSIIEYYERFNMNPKELFNYIATIPNKLNGEWYTDIRKCATEYLGWFVETDSFFDFISKL